MTSWKRWKCCHLEIFGMGSTRTWRGIIFMKFLWVCYYAKINQKIYVPWENSFFFNLFFYFKITMFLNIYINFSYVLLIEYGPKFRRQGFWVKINRKIYVPQKNSSKNFSFRFYPLGLWNFTSKSQWENLKKHGELFIGL